MPPRKLEQRSGKNPNDVPSSELESIASQKDSPESKLQQAASQAEAALAAQKTASSLRDAANLIKDPKKREKYIQDAYDKEVEAHGKSRKARMLSSGAFQGGVGGGGIGMAVGAGLGTVVGTVVGTVASIPTTAVGTVVGMGVGGVHGPWIKLGLSGKKDGEGKEKEDKEKKEGKETKKGDVEVKEEEIDVEDAVPNPELLRQVADEIAEERRNEGQLNDADDKGDNRSGQEPIKEKEKKKPRKIQVRSKSTTNTSESKAVAP